MARDVPGRKAWPFLFTVLPKRAINKSGVWLDAIDAFLTVLLGFFVV